MGLEEFEENRVHAGRFAAAFVSGLINVAVAVYFQFFSSIHFDSAKELVTFLAVSYTHLDVYKRQR